MARGGRGWRRLLGLLAVMAAGCANGGPGPNPAENVRLPPAADARTDAKPAARVSPAPGADGATLELRALGPTCGPVGTQFVVVATVRDADGTPARWRRLEWMLEGAGHIIEIDQGFFSGGHKVDSRYAVTYTDLHDHTVSRGNNRPQDDFDVAPGQSWCVVSSAGEGEAQLTVHAPGIANWDKNRVALTLRWVNARWHYPPPLTGRSGSEQVLTTSVEQAADRQPLPGYKVRYRVLDGPPAVLVPTQTRDAVTATDLSGFASVGIRQVTPTLGRNRVLVQVVRPPDPRSPGSAPVVLDENEAVVDWQAPDVRLVPEAPPSMTVGRETTYALTLRNAGPVAAQTLTVRTQLPEGVEFVRSDPPAHLDGAELVWTLGELGGKAERKLLVTVRPQREGTLTGRVRLLTSEGQRDEKELATQAVPPPQPKLEIKAEGPATALTGPAGGGGTPLPVACRVTLTNPGTGPATNVLLRASFTPNLKHASGQDPVELNVGTVAPGAVVPVVLTLTPVQGGQADLNVVALADDNLRAQAAHSLKVEEAGLTLTMSGPTRCYAGGKGEVTWELTATNVGKLPLRDLALRDQLPAEVAFVSATDGGRLTGNEVVWTLGELPPGAKKTVTLAGKAARPTPKALNTAQAMATAGEGAAKGTLQARAEVALTVQGEPKIEIRTTPVPALDKGGRATYTVEVVNVGSADEQRLTLTVRVSKEMKIVWGSGPGQGKFETDHIDFPAVPRLPPQSAPLKYTIVVEGVAAGDGRLTVEVGRESLGATPLRKEENTTVR
jgi:uncharacterized repeat protein (TIGR01451 family)